MALTLTPIGGGVYTIAGTGVTGPSPAHIYAITPVTAIGGGVYTITGGSAPAVVYPIRVTGATSALVSVAGSSSALVTVTGSTG